MVLLPLLCLAAASQAGPAHEHGVGRLEVGMERSGVQIHLEVPLDVLVGFERAARTDAERAKVAQALALLGRPESLFGLAASAGCKAAPVVVQAPLLQPPVASAAAPAKDGHADAEADYRFDCTATGALREVEIKLFDALPRLARLEVQAVTPKGQMKVVLRRGEAQAARLALVR